MEAARLTFQKIDFEKAMITLGMAAMESFGLIMLICGILGIKIF